MIFLAMGKKVVYKYIKGLGYMRECLGELNVVRHNPPPLAFVFNLVFYWAPPL